MMAKNKPIISGRDRNQGRSNSVRDAHIGWTCSVESGPVPIPGAGFVTSGQEGAPSAPLAPGAAAATPSLGPTSSAAGWLAGQGRASYQTVQ